MPVADARPARRGYGPDRTRTRSLRSVAHRGGRAARGTPLGDACLIWAAPAGRLLVPDEHRGQTNPRPRERLMRRDSLSTIPPPSDRAGLPPKHTQSWQDGYGYLCARLHTAQLTARREPNNDGNGSDRTTPARSPLQSAPARIKQCNPCGAAAGQFRKHSQRGPPAVRGVCAQPAAPALAGVPCAYVMYRARVYVCVCVWIPSRRRRPSPRPRPSCAGTAPSDPSPRWVGRARNGPAPWRTARGPATCRAASTRTGTCWRAAPWP